MVHKGFVADGFERVAEEFERNFTERGDLGAAFAAHRDGELVVNLWGGEADNGKAWREDTLEVIFSGTKGLVALCVLMLVDRRQLELDAPVCRYWPEFAVNGKESITVAEVASHRARMPGVRTPLLYEELVEDRRITELLAAQAPESDPRTAFAYHRMTYGWLCGEIVRRIDGRSVGRFFAEEVAAPLGLDAWIGLPEAEEHRVAKIAITDGWSATIGEEGDEVLNMIWRNPPLFLDDPEKLPWNTRAWHAAEIPGTNGVASARAMARLYSCLARGGELDGVRILSPQTLERGRRELAGGNEPFIGEAMRFGVGFALQTAIRPFGPPPDAFGHGGAGGSVHAAWPSERVGVSYVMRQLRDDRGGDPRSSSVLSALYEGLQRA